jgi:hypothetical protein
LQLKSTKQLLGRAGDRFLLLGMLGHSKEGKLSLEDLDGSVELDFSKLVSLEITGLVHWFIANRDRTGQATDSLQMVVSH